jgi:hypothetical protein
MQARRGGEKFVPKRALKANQIIAEEDAEVNRAVSADEFLTKTRRGELVLISRRWR